MPALSTLDGGFVYNRKLYNRRVFPYKRLRELY